MELAITMAQTWRNFRMLSAASALKTGITAYPACAKTALRMGDKTLSPEIERTAGRILFSRLKTLILNLEVMLLKYSASHAGNASKKRLNFIKIDRPCNLGSRTAAFPAK